jgi:hypothetical protein
MGEKYFRKLLNLNAKNLFNLNGQQVTPLLVVSAASFSFSRSLDDVTLTFHLAIINSSDLC